MMAYWHISVKSFPDFPKENIIIIYIYLADDGLLAVRCRSVEGRVAFDDGLSMVSVLSGIADT